MDLYEIIQELNKKHNITIIMITHDLDHGNLIGNKIISVTDGTNTYNIDTQTAGIYIEGQEGLEDGYYYPTIKNEFIQDLFSNNSYMRVYTSTDIIGVEVAENLKEAGVDVTIIEAGDHIMPNIDKDMSHGLHGHVRTHGVKLATSKLASEITKDGVYNIRRYFGL